MLTLQATKRDPKENLTNIRAAGNMPAVVYGLGKEAEAITISSISFIKVWREAGESTTVTLDIDGQKVATLIHALDREAVKGTPLHADFLRIDTNKVIRVHVPVEFDGIAPAVKSGVGVLVKVLQEVEIEALPKDLPHAIHADISNMDTLDSQIEAKDLVLPAGVTLITKGEEILAAIAGQQEEVEEAAPADLSSIEVEKKGKKEDEEAAA